MINWYKKTYLTDRFFFATGAIVFLFFASYVLDVLFVVAQTLLVLLILATGIDIFLLFKQKNLTLERKSSNIMSLGDENKFTISISNISDRKLDISIIDELPFQFNKRDFNISGTIDQKQTKIFNYYLKPAIRGEYIFGKVHVFIKTIIGLVHKRESFLRDKIIAVYPSVLQMRKQELNALNHISFLQGDNKLKKWGKSYEFDQIKTYVPGDDPRNINWKASSRSIDIMINHYEDERSQQIYSIIDKGRSMKTPFNGLTLLDYAINSALAFSNIVLKKQDKAGLITFSKTVDTVLKADKSPLQLKKVLHGLYKEKYNYTEPNYEQLYTTIRRTIPNRSLIFLYTNFDNLYTLKRIIPILRMVNKLHYLVIMFFEDTELKEHINSKANSILEIYQQTIAEKFVLEKDQIIKELQKHGIQSIKCDPENLSSIAINKYLELKAKGVI